MQRHDVGVCWHPAKMEGPTTFADRLKACLTAGRTVKWLSERTKIPASTIYEMRSGRQKSTTRTALIAKELGVRPEWLELGRGPRLPTDKPPPDLANWPFPSIPPDRFFSLTPDQRADIEGLVEDRMSRFERRADPRPQKSAGKRFAG